MLIAAFGDIHGNLPALEAVIKDIQSVAPDEMWCHGDISFGGPWAIECAEIVKDLGATVTRGNTEDWLTDAGQSDGDSSPSLSPPGKAEATRRGREVLGQRFLEWLGSLPIDFLHPVVSDTVLTHATRQSIHGPSPAQKASARQWVEAFGPSPATVICGHTHLAFVRTLGDLVVANTGSVGAPFDGDPRASYLLLRRQAESWNFERRRIDYDRESAAAKFDTLGPFEKRFAKAIRTGDPFGPAAKLLKRLLRA